MEIKSLGNSHFTRKRVIMRIDSDVDIEKNKILDDTRLLSSGESLQNLHKRKCFVTLIGHLGRPDGVDSLYSLLPIAEWYGKYLNKPITQAADAFGGWFIGKNIRLLENIRFFVEEEKNDTHFAKELASLGEIFINEAFAVSHRAHASTVGITRYLPSYAGIHFEKEVKVLKNVLQHPKRPLVVIIGGAKIETKLPMVEKMHSVADFVLVGGEVADHTRELIKVQHSSLPNRKSIVLVAELTDDKLDITKQSTENFIQVLQTAKSIVWNGPLGKTGHDPVTEQGTRLLADAIAHSHAYTIVGGGDTISYLKQHKLLDKFSFVSVGGGAMLEFLSGRTLPAIIPLLKQ
jgi:phosphoglycerate kinase